MASIVKIGRRWRALIRRSGGPARCMTFGTRAHAKSWAATVEHEIDQLRASGFMKTAHLTVGDLIDRYSRELYAIKSWSPSKTRDLRVLKRALGAQLVSSLTHVGLVTAFSSMHANTREKKGRADGAGGTVVGARIGYLIKVLETAANLWHFNVPLDAARSARSALKEAGMITASKQRSRRVSDAEIASIIEHLTKMQTHVPMRDIIHFALASAMRVSEITRIKWADLNEKDRTLIVRDRKHPKKKQGNDGEVPLLDFSGHDAFKIVMRQPRSKHCIFPYNPRTVGKYFIDAAAFLEIDDLNFHDLRHEAISRMFESPHRYGIPEVSLLSGHTDWGNLRRYTKLRAVDLHREGKRHE